MSLTNAIKSRQNNTDNRANTDNRVMMELRELQAKNRAYGLTGTERQRLHELAERLGLSVWDV